MTLVADVHHGTFRDVLGLKTADAQFSDMRIV